MTDSSDHSSGLHIASPAHHTRGQLSGYPGIRVTAEDDFFCQTLQQPGRSSKPWDDTLQFFTTQDLDDEKWWRIVGHF